MPHASAGGGSEGGQRGYPQPSPAPLLWLSQTWHLLSMEDCLRNATQPSGTGTQHPSPSLTRAQGSNPAPPHPHKGPLVPCCPQLSITHPGTDKNKVFPLRFILFLLKNDAQFVLHPLRLDQLPDWGGVARAGRVLGASWALQPPQSMLWGTPRMGTPPA